MTVGELIEALELYEESDPVRVFAGDLSQMFEVLGVELSEEHGYPFVQVDVITKELGE